MSKITKLPTMPAYGYYGVINNCDQFNDFDYYDAPNTWFKEDNNRYAIGKGVKNKMLNKYEKGNLNEWENHFNYCLSLATNFETPRPVMIGCNPYFSGGLYIQDGELDYEDDKDVVSDFDCKHYKFNSDMLRSPTNNEYLKYFKSYYDEAKYRIKAFEPENYTPRKSANGIAVKVPQVVVVINKVKNKK